MEKRIIYNGHDILLVVLLNSGSKIVESSTILTHTLQCFIDGNPLMEKTDLADAELITGIGDFTIQAERRIDLIGTPEDSPIVTQLIEMGFTLT